MDAGRRRRNKRRTTLCASTAKPSSSSSSLAAGGGGGSVCMICPATGTILSSLRVSPGDLSSSSSSSQGAGASVGVHSLSLFPSCFSRSSGSNKTSLALGFGSKASSSGKKEGSDSCALLMTIRPSSLPPILHWKCRLPTSDISAAGLSVSPCGHYCVCGTATGMLYIWKTLGGVLLPSSPVKAHYRQVTVLTWTSNGRFLVTGGADGMVHVFSLIDLAEQPPSTTASAKSAPIQPIRTWTKHQLAVTAIASLPSGRMASAAKDGLVVIVEISSGAVLASIRMPFPVTALIYVPENQCLAAGTVKGVICMIDLSDYAVHRTIQTGATVVKRSHRRTSEERVFGSESSSATAGGDGKAVGDGASAPYRVELRGHDRAITSLAVFQADSSDHDDFCQAPQEFLVSGDEAGALRVWDLDSRGCVRVVRPWSSRTSAGAAAGDAKASRSPSARSLHPVTSIRVLQHDEEDTPGVSASSPESMAVSVGSGSMFNGASASRETKRTSNHLANLVTPLRKFPEHQHSSTVLVPFVRRPRRDEETMSFWDVSSNNTFSYERALRKRRRKHELGSSKNNPTQGSESYTPCTEDEVHESQDDKNEEVQRLRKELEEARSTIQRWEAVNNKLIARLQQQA